jgi:hypothetical protein
MKSKLSLILSCVGITVVSASWDLQKAWAEEKADKQCIEVKVLVLNFDPLVPKASGGTQRLHEALMFYDPRKLAEQYVADLDKATAGSVRLKISDWRDLDQIPPKKDGFKYDIDTYLKLHRDGKGWHERDAVDYARVVAQNNVAELIENGAVDEVWLFGGPYFGYWESAMAGPRSFYINGGPLPDIKCKRPFVIMGFNYERGVAEMLHSLCHRIESTMARFSGGWQLDNLTTPWARFAANAKQSNGQAGCGSCHYPPNADNDYDYGNKRMVSSSADDWLNYPNLKGTKSDVNCETWGGPDYQRNYFIWWYTRFPKADGVNPASIPTLDCRTTGGSTSTNSTNTPKTANCGSNRPFIGRIFAATAPRPSS